MARIPGVSGGGIGPGSPGTDAGPSVLLGSVNYTANASGTSALSLKVGHQTIADWDGAAPMVRFGANAAPDVPGGVPGGSDGVGSIAVAGGTPLTPVITPVALGEVDQATTIMANLVASNGPITWSGLTPNGWHPCASSHVVGRWRSSPGIRLVRLAVRRATAVPIPGPPRRPMPRVGQPALRSR